MIGTCVAGCSASPKDPESRGTGGSAGGGGAIAGAGGEVPLGVAGSDAVGGAAPTQDCEGQYGDTYPGLTASAALAPDSMGATYDGPAVVERSTALDLVVAITLDPASGGAGGASTTSAGTTHVSLTGLDPMPIMPLGSQVWLSGNLDGPGYIDCADAGFAIAVRAGASGSLLFGATNNPYRASPVPIGDFTPYCTAPDPTSLPGQRVTYSAVEVQGDATRVVHDGEPASITIDGVPYDVAATARTYTGGVYIQAQDLASLVSQLPVGELPACAQGNDPDPGVRVGLLYLDSNATYEGPVSYASLDASNQALTFEVPLAGPTSTPPTVSVYPATLFSEPSPGQQFWFSSLPTPWGGALLEREGGPVVAAWVLWPGPNEPTTLAWLADLLGVTVSVENRCAYGTGIDGTRWLVDVTLGTTPPVLLTSGSTVTFDLAGHRYAAWLMVGQERGWLEVCRT
jgi:hypothetical protein